MTYRILTVCTGNICRSPMAEIVLRSAAEGQGLDVEVDSAATTSYEVGNPIDYRAQSTLQQAGYPVSLRSARKITEDDIRDYDLILPMTSDHLRAIDRVARRVAPEERAEIRLWREFASDAVQRTGAALDVPDPWSGGPREFTETLETVEDATDNILEHAKQRL